MTAGPGAWWCFMGHQKEPLRARGITRTLPALLWSGKQHCVNQPGLAGDGAGWSVLALVHLPCYAWAEAGVTLPPISFCSFFAWFRRYAACLTSVTWHQKWYGWSRHDDGRLKNVLRVQKRSCRECKNEMCVLCTQNSLIVFYSRTNPFVGAVASLSELLMDWLTLGLSLSFQQKKKDHVAYVRSTLGVSCLFRAAESHPSPC